MFNHRPTPIRPTSNPFNPASNIRSDITGRKRSETCHQIHPADRLVVRRPQYLQEHRAPDDRGEARLREPAAAVLGRGRSTLVIRARHPGNRRLLRRSLLDVARARHRRPCHHQTCGGSYRPRCYRTVAPSTNHDIAEPGGAARARYSSPTAGYCSSAAGSSIGCSWTSASSASSGIDSDRSCSWPPSSTSAT
jgi:hypothetical protein